MAREQEEEEVVASATTTTTAVTIYIYIYMHTYIHGLTYTTSTRAPGARYDMLQELSLGCWHWPRLSLPAEPQPRRLRHVPDPEGSLLPGFRDMTHHNLRKPTARLDFPKPNEQHRSARFIS